MNYSVINASYVVALNVLCAVQMCLCQLMASKKYGKSCHIFSVTKRLWLVMASSNINKKLTKNVFLNYSQLLTRY